MWMSGYKTPADVRLDMPIESTVRIPLHKSRIAVQAIAALIAIFVSGRVLLFGTSSAFHYKDPVAILTASMALSIGNIIAIVAASIALISSASVLLRSIAKLQDAEPGLTVAPRGLKIRSENVTPTTETIPWSAIKSLETKRMRGFPYIAVQLNDPARFLAGSSTVGAAVAKLNGGVAGAPITISPKLLQISMTDLESLLQRYFAHYAAPASSKPDSARLHENESRTGRNAARVN